MKHFVFKWIFIFYILSIHTLISAQTSVHLVLKEIMHKNIDYSKIKPLKVEVDTKHGSVEFQVLYYGNCVEKYRADFNFDQDMSFLEADKSYSFSYSIKTLSSICNDNRTPYLRPQAPNGGWSSLAGLSAYSPLVNSMGAQTEAIYGKDLGRPAVYKTGSSKGIFRSSSGKTSAYTWFNFIIAAPSNLPGENFEYEFVFLYQFTDQAEPQNFTCPPPDCSGFPGTVPVWNFETQRGECWCPEGLIWDKMEKKCVSIK